MSRFLTQLPQRPPLATLIAGVLVLGGFLLSTLSWGFLTISAVAMFAPGILRELGWITDKDEFQLDAARRAGYHAYLVGGLFAFVLAIWLRTGAGYEGRLAPAVEAVLVVMWFTWLLSSLFSYWGAVRTASRILMIFGIVWLIFNILAGEGNWKVSFMQSLLAVPFFLLAWIAKRWTLVAGILLMALSFFFFSFFGLQDDFSQGPRGLRRLPVLVLFIGPLLCSGVALLVHRKSLASSE